ncbi:hypothetical protein NDU88_004302 [Pleurodeles waltl]|uniref:Uncharacterized protein n=1 Tax=Pleurodeles waltl TaxID=8319 RepID=A0AAV7NS42_PLEWA|nr:hypothetical protein NDU88_004302 [Pleurodeles waltl]
MTPKGPGLRDEQQRRGSDGLGGCGAFLIIHRSDGAARARLVSSFKGGGINVFTVFPSLVFVIYAPTAVRCTEAVHSYAIYTLELYKGLKRGNACSAAFRWLIRSNLLNP